jgi:hypothetical protein
MPLKSTICFFYFLLFFTLFTVKPKQRAKREEDLREKERKGRLGQTQEVGGSCAASNPLGTRSAGESTAEQTK